MKSFRFFSAMIRFQQKVIILLILLLEIPFDSLANPIQLPPTILEIYFEPDGDGWQIEMMMSDYIGGENLDGLKMKTLYSEALFKTGISYIPEIPFIITPEDFQTPLIINQSGDCLYLAYFSDPFWVPLEDWGLPFGDFNPGYWHSTVSAPQGEQSIAWQKFEYPENYDHFWTAKELPNTVGFSPLQVSKKATFSGFITDKNDEPLPGIKLKYCAEIYHYYTIPTVPELFTNEDGYFFMDSMFCKMYTIQFMHEEGTLGYSVVFIEPDSANYYEFKLDTLLTGIYENKPSTLQYSIFNHPNPSSSQTKFIIETSNPKPDQKGVIKIYSESGYIVDIVPVELNNGKQELNYNFNDKSLAYGLYFYNLDVRNQKVAAGKLIVK